MKIYLDMCCYNRPYDPQEQLKIHLETEAKLHIQEQIKDGEIGLVSCDYTKWQREYYDVMKPGDFMRGALDYAKMHPFKGKAKHIKL